MNNSQMLKDLATSAMKIANERENSIVEIHKNTSQKIEQRLNTILTTSTQKIESDIEKLHDIIASLSTQTNSIENIDTVLINHSTKTLLEFKTQAENINKTLDSELHNMQSKISSAILEIHEDFIRARKYTAPHLSLLAKILIAGQIISNAFIIYLIINI